MPRRGRRERPRFRDRYPVSGRRAPGPAASHPVLPEEVEGLLVAVEGRAHVLRGAGLGTLATAPRDKGARPEVGSEVEVVQGLAEGEPAHVAVVVGEGAVTEDRVREEVRRGSFMTPPGLENLALGKTVTSNMEEEPIIGEFDQITGATISPRAVVGAVRNGLEFFRDHRAEVLAEAKGEKP